MTQYHCRLMAQTGSDIIAGFSHKHGPMWKWVEGKRVSRAIWSFDWAWCVMDKTNVFATCLWLIHWVQCAVRKSTLSECPGDKNPYKYQQMKQPHQKGTEMGTTWNFCITGNQYIYIYGEKVGFELQQMVAINSEITNSLWSAHYI